MLINFNKAIDVDIEDKKLLICLESKRHVDIEFKTAEEAKRAYLRLEKDLKNGLNMWKSEKDIIG